MEVLDLPPIHQKASPFKLWPSPSKTAAALPFPPRFRGQPAALCVLLRLCLLRARVTSSPLV